MLSDMRGEEGRLLAAAAAEAATGGEREMMRGLITLQRWETVWGERQEGE